MGPRGYAHPSPVTACLHCSSGTPGPWNSLLEWTQAGSSVCVGFHPSTPCEDGLCHWGVWTELRHGGWKSTCTCVQPLRGETEAGVGRGRGSGWGLEVISPCSSVGQSRAPRRLRISTETFQAYDGAFVKGRVYFISQFVSSVYNV